MKTRIITAIVGILVLIGVLFTFDTLVFNFVIAAITLIAIHEVFKALGFGRREWPMYAVFVPYTLLIMLSSYQVWRRLVMPASFLMVLFFSIYLVVRNAQVDFAKASGLGPCAANGANEEAVKLFLEDKIGFLDIGRLVEAVVDSDSFGGDYTLADVYECDKMARAFVRAHL